MDLVMFQNNRKNGEKLLGFPFTLLTQVEGIFAKRLKNLGGIIYGKGAN